MHKSLYVLATAAALSWACSTVQAMPITGGAMRDAIDETNLVEKTAVYIVRGYRYCFYFDGWHGPGWYRCGYAFRRGLGWGGVYGWQGWHYGPAARRFGGGVTVREGRRHRDGSTIREGGSRRGGMGVREGSTYRQGTSTREGTTTRGRGQSGGGSVQEDARAGGAPGGGPQGGVGGSAGRGGGQGSGGQGGGAPGGGPGGSGGGGPGGGGGGGQGGGGGRDGR